MNLVAGNAIIAGQITYGRVLRNIKDAVIYTIKLLCLINNYVNCLF